MVINIESWRICYEMLQSSTLVTIEYTYLTAVWIIKQQHMQQYIHWYSIMYK